jgi:superfamily II DNA/RNA helicase
VTSGHRNGPRAQEELLCHLFATRGWHQVLVFARTKHGADALARTLDKAGIKSPPSMVTSPRAPVRAP